MIISIKAILLKEEQGGTDILRRNSFCQFMKNIFVRFLRGRGTRCTSSESKNGRSVKIITLLLLVPSNWKHMKLLSICNWLSSLSY